MSSRIACGGRELTSLISPFFPHPLTSTYATTARNSADTTAIPYCRADLDPTCRIGRGSG